MKSKLLESLGTLLREGADEALWRAAGSESEEGMRRALGRGANPEARDPNGGSVLAACAKMGFLGGIGALLDAGADPNARGERDGMSALEAALISWHEGAAERLLERGAKPWGLEGKEPASLLALRLYGPDGGGRAFDAALRAGGEAERERLLRWRGRMGVNALTVALEARAGEEALGKLLAIGADPEALCDGFSARDVAREIGLERFLEAAIEKAELRASLRESEGLRREGPKRSRSL